MDRIDKQQTMTTFSHFHLVLLCMAINFNSHFPIMLHNYFTLAICPESFMIIRIMTNATVVMIMI